MVQLSRVKKKLTQKTKGEINMKDWSCIHAEICDICDVEHNECKYYKPRLEGKPVIMDAAGEPPYRKSNIIYNSITQGCPNCGMPLMDHHIGVKDPFPNFCPNCGLKVIK